MGAPYYGQVEAQPWQTMLEETGLTEAYIRKTKADREPKYRMASAEPVFARPNFIVEESQ